MGEVIQLKTKKTEDELTAEKLVEIANELDSVLMKHIQDDTIDVKDLIGLVSHRLGTLLGHFENKDELWYMCEKVLKKQAHIAD